MPRDLPTWHRYLRFWRADVRADVDDEIAFHVDARTNELVDAGVDPATARVTALREFGDVDRARATLRTMDEQHHAGRRRTELLVDLWQDVRIAARSLGRAPGFVVVVTLTLALGIGLNSAVYSIVDAYLFRPLPVAHGKDLVVLAQTDAALAAPHELSYLNYLDYKSDTAIFGGLAAYSTNSMNISGGRGAERMWTEETTANFFEVIGVKPLLGRLFQPGDDQGELAHPVMVLTYDFWQAHFAGDPKVIGDTIRLNDHPITIIGVTPPGFSGVDPLLRMDGFTPLNQTWPSYGQTLRDRGSSSFYILGTIKRGVSLATARQAVKAKAKSLERDFPEVNKNVDAVLVPETLTRPNITVSTNAPRIAAAFMMLVLLVLAIACANVASLLLARATSQFREQAIRAALGASQWRLARRVIVECGMLATLGGLGALALASAAVRALSTIRVAADVPIQWTMRLDMRVMAFTLLIVLLTALFAAIAPVLSMRRTNLTDVLKSGARGTGAGQQRLRGFLVVAQLSVCVLIVVCAALFARSTANASKINPGFRTDHILMATSTPGTNGYDVVRGKALHRDVLSRLARMPGVKSAAISRYTPFGYNNDIEYVKPELELTKIPENGVGMFNNVVSPGYLATMGISVIEGRDFTEHDDDTAPKVALVTKKFASRIWPNQPALGKRFRFAKDGPMLEVIGVTSDIQYFTMGEAPKPFFFRPITQWYRGQFTLDIQTTVDPVSLINPVRAMMAEIDPALPVFDLRSMEDHIVNGRALLSTRLGAAFSGVFGALALLLAAVGLYGLMSYSVVQRTREIGIRVALGAKTSTVLRLVLRQGVTIALVGVAAGVAVAFFVTQFLSKLLYGVAPHDPLIFAGVAVTLATVGALASLIPARRAARVDPLAALRAE